MDRPPTTGLRRRSVQSTRQTPSRSPVRTASISDIDPLEPLPPTTPRPRRRRRSPTGFQHLENQSSSSFYTIARWLWRHLLLCLTIINWISKILLILTFATFIVALVSALPLEVRTKATRNFLTAVAGGWRGAGLGWVKQAAVEWVMGMAVFERGLLECLSGGVKAGDCGVV